MRPAASSAARTALPAGLPAPELSGTLPLDVAPPSDTTPEQARPWFDAFSWQSFIALNWPSDPARRGEPLEPNDPGIFRDPPPGSVTVWGTYKEAHELFGQGDERPAPWDSHETPVSPCKEVPPGTRLMLMMNKGGSLLDGIDEAFSFPLIDQNKNYAYSEVRFNRAQYDIVRGTDDERATWLYLLVNLVKVQPLKMPASKPAKDGRAAVQGAMMLKATWREMTDADELGRYYVVEALVLDPETGQCDERTMGLVGFHIAHKLASFPQWVWSSFEQIDNLEPGRGASASTPVSFNNGGPNPVTHGGFANRPPQKVPPLQDFGQRIPVQVSRFNPIPATPEGASTRDLNRIYQDLLAGTVWEHYELVITQWPTEPGQFILPGDGGIYPRDCGQPFPAQGCTNAVMETYFQAPGDAAGAGGNSCMSCHYGSAPSDFSWVLQGRAH